jgi:hypothetical protein
MDAFPFLAVLLFLMGLLIFVVLQFHKERSELLNRIMAKDLSEYASWEVEEKRAKVPHKIVRQEGIPL